MFLLGGWILCTLCVDTISYINVRLPEAVMATAPPPAEKMISTLGTDAAEQLLHHFAAEGNRLFLDRWETLEILLGVILVPLVYFAMDRRVPPVVLAGVMLILVLFQYFAVSSELAYRGRETDFPPGRGNVVAEKRVWDLTEAYIVSEALLVLSGSVLAVYIASYKSRRRVRHGESVASRDAAMRGI